MTNRKLINRRSLMKGGAGVALGLTFMPYKAMSADEAKMNLYTWDNYLGDTTLSDFKNDTGIDVKVDIYGANDDLFAKLKAGNPGYDVVLPSSNWVQRFAKAGMIIALDHGKIPNVKNYDKAFMDPEWDPGRKFSLPWVWGTFGIGYNKTKAKTTPDSWHYLLDKTDFAGRISIQADQEYALGVALQALGYSWNSTNAKELAKAKDLLIASKKNIKLFAKDNGDSLLASGDVDICAEYSGDVLGQMQKDTTNSMNYVLPKEGGNSWQDTLAIAKGAPHLANAYKYINWTQDTKNNATLMAAINYPTPNAAAKATMSDDYKNNPIIFPPADQMKKVEPSVYLGEEATQAREDIWTAIQAA
jgi:spermidine/putrescine transport system substrate-binding protein